MQNGKKNRLVQSVKLNQSKGKGFTLIELLVVLTIIALLLTLASPRYFSSLDRTKEATLRHDLNTLRDGIDKYYADRGKYPTDLAELVELKYINKLPVDPITESEATWQLTPPEPPLEGNVYDVHSGATGLAKDGTAYASW